MKVQESQDNVETEVKLILNIYFDPKMAQNWNFDPKIYQNKKILNFGTKPHVQSPSN